MTHFALIAPPLRGHYNPMSALAEELVRRGHRATFVHQADAAELVSGTGVGFASLGSGAAPLAGWTSPMARIRGLIGLKDLMGGMAAFTDLLCAQGPDVLRRIGADVIIADQLEPAGGLLAEHLGLPFASVANALPINREEGVPPPYLGWRYDPSERGRARNRSGYRISDWLMRNVGDAVERNAAKLGLRPRRLMEDCLSPALQISQAVPSLDFPREALPDSFHYVGPLRRAAVQSFDLEDDGRPLIFCSLGTLQGSRTGLFTKVARACADLDLRLLIAHGGLGDAERLRSLPGAPLVYDWVPYQAVLARASVVVSHAGFNTMIDTAAAGLPMVLVPLAFEQPAIAARAEHAGIARRLPKSAGARSIAKALHTVLTDSRYCQRGQAIAAEVKGAGGVTRAADLIEALA